MNVVEEKIKQVISWYDNPKEYNLDKLTNEDISIIAERLLEHYDVEEIIREDLENYASRICQKCGKIVKKGYVTGDFKYYCSDECLHQDYTEEEWAKLYEEDPDDFYYTEWY